MMDEIPTLKERVDGLLAKLGETPGEVVDNLRSMGIKGTRGDGESCLIANYLRREIGPEADEKHLSVGNMYTVTGMPEAANPEARTLRRLTSNPLPVATVIRAFDKGEFPDLEES
jgi:hypothetical protein